MGDGAPSNTIDEALTAMGFGKFQLLVLTYAGLGWTAEAMEVMILSVVGPAVQSAWSLSPQQENSLTSVVFAGTLIGAYAWGIVSDKHGRRKGFLIPSLITATAGLLSAFSPSFIFLIFFRFMVGIGLGGGHVLASWFLEFVPAPNRGTWMVVFSTFWTLGTIMEASLAWLIMPRLGWRWLLALSSLPSILLLLFYSMTPESPRYLCSNGRSADAVIILEKIAKMNGTTLPPGIIISDIQTDPQRIDTEESSLLSPENEGGPTKAMNNDFGGISSFLMLLSAKLARPTLLLWIVFFGNAFSYYGLVLLTSEWNSGRSKCNSDSLQSEKTNDVSYRDVFVASFAELPGLLLSAAAVDKIGRKISMSAMLFVYCIFLLPLVFHLPEGLITVLLFGARTCIMGSFTIIYIYAPEIYPTSVRSTGVGIASAVSRIGGIVCPLVAVGLVHYCQQTEAVLLFVMVAFVSGICVILFPVETMGRELVDNESELNKN
ncbi:hypothetical protein QN277_024471 [Acacia crassicarpa]|nr:hypothetical protein QN277_024471 [Acacia crassicarpa]